MLPPELLDNLPSLLSGVVITLILMLSSLCIGFFLAIALCIADYLGNIVLKKLVQWLVFFICGTPLLVQLFLLYFGLSQFDWIRESPLWIVLSQPMACAIIALSINTACYSYVLLKGAIASIPVTEIEASAAVGMSAWQGLKYIILPRALRIFLPAYSNEVMMILKGTALASTITIMDIMGVTQLLISKTYITVDFYIVAGLIYLLLTAIITLIFRLVQKRMKVLLV